MSSGSPVPARYQGCGRARPGPGVIRQGLRRATAGPRRSRPPACRPAIFPAPRCADRPLRLPAPTRAGNSPAARLASPACSAIDQQFTRGSPASRPRTNDAIRRLGSTRANRPPTRSISSSNSCRQRSRSTLRPAAIARSTVVHTPSDHRAVAASRPRLPDQTVTKCRWRIRRSRVRLRHTAS